MNELDKSKQRFLDLKRYYEKNVEKYLGSFNFTKRNKVSIADKIIRNTLYNKRDDVLGNKLLDDFERVIKELEMGVSITKGNSIDEPRANQINREAPKSIPKGKVNNNSAILATTIIIILIAIVVISTGANSGDKTNVSRDTLIYESQRAVKNELKAPSTAKFPVYSSFDVNSTHRSDGKYEVSSYVDAENSFGVPIRSYFTVYITFSSHESYRSRVVFE